MTDIRQYKCVYRSGYHGEYYSLLDNRNYVREYQYFDLKQLMLEKKIQVSNLKIENDEIRFVGSKEEEERHKEAIKDAEEKLAVARMLGTLTELKFCCDKTCYVIHIDGKAESRDTILYIPDNVKHIASSVILDIMGETEIRPRGKMKVVGGAGINIINNMFFNVRLEELDLNHFYCINAYRVTDIFANTETEKIHMNRFLKSIRNAINLHNLFSDLYTNDILISDCTFNYVRDISGMFYFTHAKNISLTNVHFNNLESAEEMFDRTEADKVIVKGCTFKNNISEYNSLPKLGHAFRKCNIKEIISDVAIIKDGFEAEMQLR